LGNPGEIFGESFEKLFRETFRAYGNPSKKDVGV